MANFSEDQISEFQEAFALFDNRNDGMISVSLLGNVLRAFGQNPTEAEVRKCCSQFKPDDRITFEMFLPILQAISKNRCTDRAEDFIEGLRHFDKDGSGYISSAEMRHILTRLGEKMTEEEVEQLLAGQENSQGNINYEDFVLSVLNDQS
ncbi:Myosin-2 essential light chain, partial [Fragariocoptes setiger]